MNKRYELNARINYDGVPDFTDEVERDILKGYIYSRTEGEAIEKGIQTLTENITANGYEAEYDGESVSVRDENGEIVETYYDFSVKEVK